MALKFAIGKPEPEPGRLLHLWLETEGDHVILQAEAEVGVGWCILEIGSDGRIHRADCVGEDVGLDLDPKGRVRFDDE